VKSSAWTKIRSASSSVTLTVRTCRFPYDYLILATGASQSYFGHNEFEQFAPGLKTLADAVGIRNKILQAFELAEAEEDPSRHRDLLTFVLVGAGPTGVELAGALAMLVRSTLKSEFRRIDPASARIVLVDLAPRVLGTFSEDLSKAAKQQLDKLGVEVRLGHGADQIDADGVTVAGDRIATKTVIWTAGVAPSLAGKWLKVETDRAGRVRVQNDLTVPGYPEYLLLATPHRSIKTANHCRAWHRWQCSKAVMQGSLFTTAQQGEPAPGPFNYFDKGNMAVVGKGFAVLQSGKVHVSGFAAWLAWAAVHLQFLATSSLRLSVFLQWVWTYLTGQRGSRLIVNYHGSELEKTPPGTGARAVGSSK